MQMLLHARECVTPEILEQIEKRHQEAGSRFVDRFRSACEEEPRRWLQRFVGCWHTLDDSEVSRSFRDALDTAIALASANPQFESLARKALNKDLNTPGWRTIFTEDAYDVILQWQPPPWHISSSNELSALEATIAISSAETSGLSYDEWDMRRDFSTAIWYFSATAVAIQFLQRLSVLGLKLRKIIIKEDHKGVAHPAYHTEGLIPFCQNDPQLRIERQIGCWSCMYPAGWPHILISAYTRPDELKQALFYRVLYAVIDWVCETDRLTELGMPAHSCFTEFDVRSDDELLVWSLLKQATNWQESMQRWIEVSGQAQPRLENDPRFQGDPYPLPCFLPKEFPRAVRAVLQGTPSVGCSGFVGNLQQSNGPHNQFGQEWDSEEWRGRWSNWYTWTLLCIPGGNMQTFLRPYSTDESWPKPLNHRLI